MWIFLMSTKQIDFEQDLKKKQKIMEQELEQERLKKKNTIKAGITSDDLNSIIQDYRDKYSQNNVYQEGYKEPGVEDGKAYLTFPSEEKLGEFMTDQAEKGRVFIVVDGTTNKVMAYSNGNGKLYNGDGSYYEGGRLQRSIEDYDNFIMPERENNLRK